MGAKLIVNRRTGYVIDGHARIALAITKGAQVPVVYVDLDEAEEAAIASLLSRVNSLESVGPCPG